MPGSTDTKESGPEGTSSGPLLFLLLIGLLSPPRRQTGKGKHSQTCKPGVTPTSTTTATALVAFWRRCPLAVLAENNNSEVLSVCSQGVCRRHRKVLRPHCGGRAADDTAGHVKG